MVNDKKKKRRKDILTKREKDIITKRMATGPEEPYFEAEVPEADQFMPPDITSLSQFFFTPKTAKELVEALDGYKNPCCLCTPRLAHEWFTRGRRVTLLDIDSQFSEFADYIHYDLRNPTPLDRSFDVIVADPPFFIAKLFHKVLSVLTAGSKPDLFLVFDNNEEKELLRVFADYGLSRTDYDLEHNNVKPDYRPSLRLYTNRPELLAQNQVKK